MTEAEIIKSLLGALLGWMDQPDTTEAYDSAMDRAMLAMEQAKEYLKQAPITLPERCNSISEQLDNLAEEFKQLGLEGHRLRIVDLAGHLRIYAHQVRNKLEESNDKN